MKQKYERTQVSVPNLAMERLRVLQDAGIPISNLLAAVALFMSTEDILALMVKARQGRFDDCLVNGAELHTRLLSASTERSTPRSSRLKTE